MSRSQRRGRDHRGRARRGPGRRGVHRRRGHRALARRAGGHGVLHHRGPEPAGGRPARRRASGSSWCRSSGATASPGATARRRSPTSGPCSSGPIPARVLRAAQFHEFVAQLVEWGAQGDVTYVPRMRTQLVAARTVAEALADLATASNGAASAGAPILEIAGPREESLVDMASAARRPARRHGADRGGERPGRPGPGGLRDGRPAARARRHPRRPDVRGVARRGGLRPTAQGAQRRPQALERIGDPRQRDRVVGCAAPPSAARRWLRRAGSWPSGSAARPGRRRTPRPRARRRRGRSSSSAASCAPVLTPCAASEGRSGSRSGYR